MSEKTMDSQNNTNYVTSKTPDGMEIQFILNNVNYSIANALRRVIISDIPCVVFKTFPHEENLTKIHKINHPYSLHCKNETHRSPCRASHDG